MTNDSKDRGDGRDARGRWIKGITGNPNGRPRGFPDLDMSDVLNFATEPMKIAIGGETKLMTRHEVLLLKTFESALKGRVTSQRYLLEKFEQAEMSREAIELWLEQWAERIDDDPDSVPSEVPHVMRRVLQARERPRSSLRKITVRKRRRS